MVDKDKEKVGTRVPSRDPSATIMRAFITAAVGAIVGALLMMMLNSRAEAVQVSRANEDIQDLQRRLLTVEQAGAQDHAQLQSLVSKVDDMWNVIVLGQRPVKRP